MEKRKKKDDDKAMLKHISEAIMRHACAIEDLARAIREPRKHDVIKIFVCQPAPAKPRVRFEWGIGQPQNKEKENNMPIKITLTNEQKVKVTLAPVTDTGKPAKLDGKPTWEVVTGNATVEVAEDGMSATLISADDPGDTQFMVRADADIGEGVEEISDIVTLNVVGATAKNLGLVAGTPEAK